MNAAHVRHISGKCLLACPADPPHSLKETHYFDFYEGDSAGQKFTPMSDEPCGTCGVMREEPDEAIQLGDYYTVDPTSLSRCPRCGMVPARDSQGAFRVALARALLDVCRHFCTLDQHDDACVTLHAALDSAGRYA